LCHSANVHPLNLDTNSLHFQGFAVSEPTSLQACALSLLVCPSMGGQCAPSPDKRPLADGTTARGWASSGERLRRENLRPGFYPGFPSASAALLLRRRAARYEFVGVAA